MWVFVPGVASPMFLLGFVNSTFEATRLAGHLELVHLSLEKAHQEKQKQEEGGVLEKEEHQDGSIMTVSFVTKKVEKEKKGSSISNGVARSRCASVEDLSPDLYMETLLCPLVLKSPKKTMPVHVREQDDVDQEWSFSNLECQDASQRTTTLASAFAETEISTGVQHHPLEITEERDTNACERVTSSCEGDTKVCVRDESSGHSDEGFERILQHLQRIEGSVKDLKARVDDAKLRIEQSEHEWGRDCDPAAVVALTSHSPSLLSPMMEKMAGSVASSELPYSWNKKLNPRTKSESCDVEAEACDHDDGEAPVMQEERELRYPPPLADSDAQDVLSFRLWEQEAPKPKRRSRKKEELDLETALDLVADEYAMSKDLKLPLPNSGFRRFNLYDDHADAATKTSAADQKTSAGLFDQKTSAGLFDQKKSAGLFDQKKSAGLFDQKKSAGLFDQKKSAGLFDQKKSAGLCDQKTSAGLFDQKESAGLFDQKESAGLFDQEKSAGLCDQKTSAGFSDQKSSAGLFDQKTSAGLFDQKSSTDSFDLRSRRAQPKVKVDPQPREEFNNPSPCSFTCGLSPTSLFSDDQEPFQTSVSIDESMYFKMFSGGKASPRSVLSPKDDEVSRSDHSCAYLYDGESSDLESPTKVASSAAPPPPFPTFTYNLGRDEIGETSSDESETSLEFFHEAVDSSPWLGDGVLDDSDLEFLLSPDMKTSIVALEKKKSSPKPKSWVPYVKGEAHAPPARDVFVASLPREKRAPKKRSVNFAADLVKEIPPSPEPSFDKKPAAASVNIPRTKHVEEGPSIFTSRGRWRKERSPSPSRSAGRRRQKVVEAVACSGKLFSWPQKLSFKVSKGKVSKGKVSRDEDASFGTSARRDAEQVWRILKGSQKRYSNLTVDEIMKEDFSK